MVTQTTWTNGDSSASQTLLGADHLYPVLFNELRTAINTLESHSVRTATKVVGTAEPADYVCDGTADDVQIQAAITAVNTAGGGVVFIKESTYAISADISIPSNITIMGENDSTILQFPSTGTDLSCFVNSDTTNGNSNITIRNLRIDGNKTSRTGNADWGMYFDNIDNLKIKDVTIINSRWTDIYLTNITNGLIDGYYGSAARTAGLDMGLGCSYMRVVNCYVENITSDTGLFADSYRLNGTDNLYSNCISYNCADRGFGIGTGTWATRAVRCTIENCISYVSRDYGFFFGYAEDCSIKGCVARMKDADGNFKASSAGGGIGFQYVTGLLIDGNVCTENYYSGIACSDQTTGQIARQIVIGNNICLNNDGTDGHGQAGIFLYATSDASILECLVENNICGDNQTTATQGLGIRTSTGTNKNHIIRGNYCFGNYGTGISVATSGGAAIVSENYCYNNGRETTGYGIITTSLSNSSICNNVCFDDQTTATQLYGIYMTHTAATNRFHTVNGNVCRGNKEYGIYLKNGSYISVVGNQCTDNSQETDNTYSGIYLDGITYSTITGNSCTSSLTNKQKYGIEEANTCTNNNIIGNIVAGNDTAGILLTSTTDYVSRNQGYVTENSGTGTIASGATTSVVTHGLAVTPTLDDISITFGEQGTADYGRWWISNLTSTQFTLNVSVDPGVSALDFSWRAVVL